MFRPPSWVVTFDGTTNARRVVLIYTVKSGQDRIARFFAPLPDDVVFALVNRLNAAGFGVPWGGTFFNKSIVGHLVVVEPL